MSRGFEYFHHCCIETIFEGLHSEPIKRYLMQMSHYDEALRAAIFALSSTHETASYRTGINEEDTRFIRDSQYTESLTSTSKGYFQAIRLLNTAICHRGKMATPTVLACCLLFTAIEMLRRQYNVAVTHIESGLDIISEAQLANPTITAAVSLQPVDIDIGSGGVITDAIICFFRRFSIAIYLYGRPQRLLREASASQLAYVTHLLSLTTLDEASRSLTVLSGDALTFSINVNDYRYSGIVPVEFYSARDKRISELTNWHTSFQAMMAGQDHHRDSSTLLYFTLETQYYAILILLGTCLETEETAFDRYFDQFRAILLLCHNYTAKMSIFSKRSPHQKTTFTVDMGILPQLWFVVLKCRHHEYRKWAISLLGKYQRREGMWDPALLCHLGRRVMEIEEAPLRLMGNLISESSLPGEFDRLWSVKIHSADFAQSIATFSYRPAEPGGNCLTWKEKICTNVENTAN